MSLMTIGIVGGTSYISGELLRLLLHHPQVKLTQVGAKQHLGDFLHVVHPHLRGQSTLRFVSQDQLNEVDLLFLNLPKGEAAQNIVYYAKRAERIIDLSSDFRLNDAAAYRNAYGTQHPAPDWLERFVYGLPELNRQALMHTHYASGIGCNAAATLFAMWALVEAKLLTPDHSIIADLKVGSSEGGRDPSVFSHHATRSGAVSPFSLVGHRHEAEITQQLGAHGAFDVRLSVTNVEMVRGVSAAVHVSLPPDLSERDLWSIYHNTWQAEPFVRLIHEAPRQHPHPEPRLVAGTNFVDIGWEYQPDTGRAVLLAALDNLNKGAAGSAVQSMNLMCGFDENTGLNFGGYYP